MPATAGPDILIGTTGADVISGLAGNDIIYGHGAADASQTAGTIHAVRVGTGFTGAVFATSSPDNPDHLFIVRKDTGQIHRLDPATGNAAVFLDIPNGELATGGEQGLLGLAFHPDYAINGRFFVHLVNANGDVEVREYRRSAGDPNVADLAMERTIITVPHPLRTNHNGGFVGFGPNDGYLYVSIGDGGGSNDPDNNAQNINTLLGKILRIDIDDDDFPANPDKNYAIPATNPFVGQAGADEIWAYGLRNPWRISFDSATGDLYIGDVGQNAREEIDFQPAASDGGENYGWDEAEGTLGTPLPGSILPIFEYGHDKGVAVTGGYVYRGGGPALTGSYFFADFASGRLWTLEVAGGDATNVTERTTQLSSPDGPLNLISSFGVDGNGKLYIVTLTGGIFRIDPTALAGDVADQLFGGDGDDKLYGGAGDDMLNGGHDNDMLSGGFGDDLLDGSSGVDTTRSGAGDDTYVVNSASDRVIEALGEGQDRVNSTANFTLGSNVEHLTLIGASHVRGTGNGLANTITGNAGNNILDGASGKDILRGGAGHDVLNGSFGSDTLTGGTGNDIFLFNTTLTTSNVDRITDFSVSNDTIELENAVFTRLTAGTLAPVAFFRGTAAHDADDRIIYNSATGGLIYDSNGSASGGAVHFATLGAGLLLTNTDFFVT